MPSLCFQSPRTQKWFWDSFYAVSPAMNIARYNVPDCVVPVEEPEPEG